MSLVSVIIPCYNAARWLPACLNSCLQQQNAIHEIIVIDDHSEDESWRVMNEYATDHPSLIKVFRNKEKGGNNARNYGFELSTGQYIQWLDADDQILEGKLQAQIGMLRQDLALDVAYSDWKQVFWDQQGHQANTLVKTKGAYKDFLYEILIDNWSPPVSYLLTRRAAMVLHECKAWNPLRVAAQDREYFSLAAIRGFKFCYVPGIFSAYNSWSGGTVSMKISPQKKAEVICSLLKDLRSEITAQSWISEAKKKSYCRVLNAQILTFSTINGLPVDVLELKRAGVNFSIIKGIRTRIKTLRRYLLNINGATE